MFPARHRKLRAGRTALPSTNNVVDPLAKDYPYRFYRGVNCNTNAPLILRERDPSRSLQRRRADWFYCGTFPSESSAPLRANVPGATPRTAGGTHRAPPSTNDVLDPLAKNYRSAFIAA